MYTNRDPCFYTHVGRSGRAVARAAAYGQAGHLWLPSGGEVRTQENANASPKVPTRPQKLESPHA